MNVTQNSVDEGNPPARLKEVFIESFQNVLGSSFEWMRSKALFRKKFKGGTCFISFPEAVYTPFRIYTVHIDICVDSIKKLCCKVFGRDISLCCQVSFPLWRLCGFTSRPLGYILLPNTEFDFVFTYWDRESLDMSIVKCSHFLTEKVIPFLETIRSVEDAHRAFNIDRFDVQQMGGFYGIVAAFMADRNHWRDFIKEYSDIYSKWPEPTPTLFLEGVSVLKKMEETGDG